MNFFFQQSLTIGYVLMWYNKHFCVTAIYSCHQPHYPQQVPSRNQSSNAGIFLEEFRSEIPIFKLLGTPKMVESTAQYSDVSDPDVQLVCKYLKAYDMEIGGMKRINTLYKEGTDTIHC